MTHRKAHGRASVTTPAIPRPGNGPEWEALRAATTREQLAELDYKASCKGYGADGKLRSAIRAKLAELGG